MPQTPTIRRTDGETITDRERCQVRILVAGDDALTVTWSRYAQGERGPELHVHREHTDAFYVISGTVTYTLGATGERVERASAGTIVVVPPEVPHTFRNDDEADATFLNVHTPDTGFADYLRTLRDGLPAAFDSYALPVDGTRPAGEAVVAAGAYEAGDLRIVAGAEAVEITAAGSSVSFTLAP